MEIRLTHVSVHERSAGIITCHSNSKASSRKEKDSTTRTQPTLRGGNKIIRLDYIISGETEISEL